MTSKNTNVKIDMPENGKWQINKIKKKKTKTVFPQKLPKPIKTQGTNNMRIFLNTKLVRPLFSRK